MAEFPRASGSGDGQEGKERVQAVVRFRPVLDRESAEEERLRVNWSKRNLRPIALYAGNMVDVTDTQNTSHSFQFDGLFDPSASQEKVFTERVEPLVEDLLKGINTTVIAYGAAGGGKTYTIFGPDIFDLYQMGLASRVIQALFKRVSEDTNDTEFSIKCSCMEICNEAILDLLNPKNTNLKLMETQSSVEVVNLTTGFVATGQDALDFLVMAQTVRAGEAKKEAKGEKNRGHCFFTIKVFQQLKDGSHLNSKMELVDLASDMSLATGRRATSTDALAVLHACIEEPSADLSFRKSKLTFLLKDHLGGSSRCVFLAACSSCSKHIDETVATLQFVKRVRSMENTVRVNREKSYQEMVSIIQGLQKELQDTKEYARGLEAQLQEAEADAAADAGVENETEPSSSTPVTQQTNTHTTDPTGNPSVPHLMLDRVKKKDTPAAPVSTSRMTSRPTERAAIRVEELKDALRKLNSCEAHNQQQVADLQAHLSAVERALANLRGETKRERERHAQEIRKYEADAQKKESEIKRLREHEVDILAHNMELQAGVERLEKDVASLRDRNAPEKAGNTTEEKRESNPAEMSRELSRALDQVDASLPLLGRGTSGTDNKRVLDLISHAVKTIRTEFSTVNDLQRRVNKEVSKAKEAEERVASLNAELKRLKVSQNWLVNDDEESKTLAQNVEELNTRLRDKDMELRRVRERLFTTTWNLASLTARVKEEGGQGEQDLRARIAELGARVEDLWRGDEEPEKVKEKKQRLQQVLDRLASRELANVRKPIQPNTENPLDSYRASGNTPRAPWIPSKSRDNVLGGGLKELEGLIRDSHAHQEVAISQAEADKEVLSKDLRTLQGQLAKTKSDKSTLARQIRKLETSLGFVPDPEDDLYSSRTLTGRDTAREVPSQEEASAGNGGPGTPRSRSKPTAKGKASRGPGTPRGMRRRDQEAATGPSWRGQKVLDVQQVSEELRYLSEQLDPVADKQMLSDIATLNKRISTITTSKDDELAAAQAEMQVMEKLLKDFEEQVAEAEAEKDDLYRARKERDQLQKQVQEAQTQLGRGKSEQDHLHGKLKELEKQLTATQGDLKRHLEASRKEKNDYEEKIQSLQTALAEGGQSANDKQKARAIESQLRLMTADRDFLAQKLEDLEQRVRAAQARRK